MFNQNQAQGCLCTRELQTGSSPYNASSLDAGLGGHTLSLSESEPSISRLLALCLICSARCRTPSCHAFSSALFAGARCQHTSHSVKGPLSSPRSIKGFPYSGAGVPNLGHLKQITYVCLRTVMILPGAYRSVPRRGLIPQSIHHRCAAIYPNSPIAFPPFCR